MKKLLWLILFIVVLAYPSHAFNPLEVCSGAVAGGGLACSGDMSDGDVEDFEKGDGSFCTTDWTEVDVDGVVDTYDNGFAHCGSNSLKVTCDGDNANEPNNRVYVDLGGTDTDVYERFYIKLPTLDSGQYLRFHNVGNDNNESEVGGTLYFQWYNSSGTYRFNWRNGGGTQDSDYFNLTPGNKYRIEAHIIQNGAAELKVWDSTDTAVETSNGGGDYIQGGTGGNTAIQYFIFRDHNSSSTEATYSIEDYIIDVDGVDYIGAQSCS